MTSALPGLDRLPPLTRPELALWRASRDSLPAFHRLAWINVPREEAGRYLRTLPTSGSSPLKTERYRFRSLQGDEGRLQRGATRQDWWEPVILHRPVMAAYFSCREGRKCCARDFDYNRFRRTVHRRGYLRRQVSSAQKDWTPACAGVFGEAGVWGFPLRLLRRHLPRRRGRRGCVWIIRLRIKKKRQPEGCRSCFPKGYTRQAAA